MLSLRQRLPGPSPLRIQLLGIALSWLLLSMSLSLGAQESAPAGCQPLEGGDPQSSPCAQRAPASLADDGEPGHGAGNPIDVLTGNKYQRETDLPALPGVLGLEIVRHYNSAQAGRDAALGAFGRGWRLSYETELKSLSAGTVLITQADGRQLYFDASAEADDFFFAQRPVDGWLWREQGAGFVWCWPDGRQLSFSAEGRLMQIRLASGHFVSLSRGPAGELLSVTDPQGRSLQFEYAERTHRGFRGVRAIHSPLGRFEYRHEDELNSPGVGNLREVIHPDGGRRHYHYGADEPALAAALPHHLTGISLTPAASEDDGAAPAERQRLATYAYDTSGRAVLSVKGVLPSPPARGLEQVELRYPVTGHSILTNSLGEETHYRHQRIGGQPRLQAVIGAGCSSCGPGNRRYRHDEQGQLLTITLLDDQGRARHSLLLGRDALGRISSRWLLSHTARAEKAYPRLIEMFDYAGDGFLPARYIRPSVIAGRYYVRHHDYDDRQQLLELREEGFSPLSSTGALMRDASEASPLSRRLVFRYLQQGGRALLHRVEDEDGVRRQFDWDGQGNFLRALRYPDGSRTAFERDRHSGLLRAVHRHDGLIIRFTHDARQQLQALRQETGSGSLLQALTFSHDAFGQLARVRQQGGTAAEWLQDWSPWGQLRARLDPRGMAEVFDYDSENRLRRQHRYSAGFSLEHFLDYDAQHRLQRVSDSLGRGFRLIRDDHGRLLRREDDDGIVMAYPAAATTTGAVAFHDDFGREVYRHDDDRGELLRTYDQRDRLITSRDAGGNEVRFEHAEDSAAGSRLHRRQIFAADGELIDETRWEYDPRGGRLRAIHHPQQQERYHYDDDGQKGTGAGRLQQRELILDPRGRAIRVELNYQYDEVGRLRASSLADGRWLHYRRNDQGQLVALELGAADGSERRLQTIVRALERDLFGLRSLYSGNGMLSLFERSRGGVLARILHRQQAPARAPRGLIAAAHAADAEGAGSGALLERKLLWDQRGNLLRTQESHGEGRGRTVASGAVRIDSHAYNARSELVASSRWQQQGGQWQESARWLQAYDDRQRLLGRQSDGETHEQAYPHASPLSAAAFDAVGNATRYGALQLHWNAAGLLIEASRAGRPLARYDYDHRGWRIHRQLHDPQGKLIHSRFTVRDHEGQPLAELDDEGRILRQYLWLADLPVALIDSPAGILPAGNERGLYHRLRLRWQQSTQPSGDVYWLHLNHLGAPELVSDAAGVLRWRADYAPFGAARITADNFNLDLRLPGQHFDAETGLHYNRARYYDPASGHYLSPDPLGQPDGPNPYAYAAFNPLRYVDPQGLLLFAFDGTGQDESDPNTLSNVVYFREAYEAAGGDSFYITGPGTLDPRSRIKHPTLLGGNSADALQSFTGKARVAFLLNDLHNYADTFDDDEAIPLDIIGYSRGGAEARDFANQIAANTVDGWYAYSSRTLGEQCQRVDFRFLGLWDTVLSTHVGSYELGIPDAFQHVAQAVAVNEYRGYLVAFPLESVMGSPVPAHQTRIERGFLGAHGDIGGGFADGELAKVALNWMVEQAKAAEVELQSLQHLQPQLNASNVFHDSSSNLLGGGPGPSSEDRQVRYLDDTIALQREAEGLVLDWSESQRFIRYRSNPNSIDKIAGEVDMAAYVGWLKTHGYTLDMETGSTGE